MLNNYVLVILDVALRCEGSCVLQGKTRIRHKEVTF